MTSNKYNALMKSSSYLCVNLYDDADDDDNGADDVGDDADDDNNGISITANVPISSDLLPSSICYPCFCASPTNQPTDYCFMEHSLSAALIWTPRDPSRQCTLLHQWHVCCLQSIFIPLVWMSFYPSSAHS